MSSNVQVTKSGGFTSVTIHTISVKENFINAIEQFNIPRTEIKFSEGYIKHYLDFLQVTRTIEVTGYIATEQDGSTPATTLRTDLIKIFGGGGDVSVVYTPETITGPMTGLEIREVPADHNTPRFFLVTFSVMEAISI